MKTKTVFVLGRPASGKSTFLRFLAAAIKKSGQSVIVINDLDVLKQICPKIKDAKEKEYFYRGESLILEALFRKKILERMFEEVSLTVIKAQNCCNYCLVEFAHPEWKQKLEKYFKEIFRFQPALVFVSLGKKKSLERNRVRKEASFIPEEYIELFKEGETKATTDWFKKKFSTFFEINNRGEKDKLSFYANEILSQLGG